MTHQTTAAGEINIAGPTRILFLDMAELEETSNIEPVVCEATKHPANPILPLGYAHEFDGLAACMWGGGGSLYDAEESLFRIWYHAHGREYHPDDGAYSLRTSNTGYAYSSDGVNFVKPHLGRHKFGGNRENNIVLPGICCCPVLIDPTQPDPDKRYATFIVGESGATPADGWTKELWYSADGIDWKRGPEVYRGSIETNDFIDMRTVIIDEWDSDPNRRYKVYGQSYAVELNRSLPSGYKGELKRRKVRSVGLWYGPDLEHLIPHPGNPILHPNDGVEHEIHFCSVVQYHGFYVMLYEHDWYEPAGRIIGDIRLACSRDGIHFTRLQPERAVIPTGTKAEWDGGMLVTSPEVIEHDGKLWIYYTGVTRDWKGWPSGRPAGAPSPSTLYPQHLGLATLPLDGFVRLQTRNKPVEGWFRTAPVSTASGGPLRVSLNVSGTCPDESWVTVAVLDAATHQPLPGYDEVDCRRLTTDGPEASVCWRAGDHIDAQTPVKLRVTVYGEAELRALVLSPAK